jgi:hypothetical protein
VADYSEFPTTPTAWQDVQAQDWESITPLSTEDPAPPRRRVDLVALVPGVLFAVLAIGLMAGVTLPYALAGGSLVWTFLVVAGIALLVRELRKGRRRP